jgi:hypothetical protein
MTLIRVPHGCRLDPLQALRGISKRTEVGVWQTSKSLQWASLLLWDSAVCWINLGQPVFGLNFLEPSVADSHETLTVPLH